MLKNRGDKLFNIVILSTLAVFIAFFLILILSTIHYVEWGRAGEILFSDEILFAIKLSVITATVSSILAMIFSIPVALALSRINFPGKDWVDALLDLPIILSPVAVGALLLVFFNNTRVGNFVEDNVIEFTFQVPGIILAQFIIVVALAIRLLKSTFDGIDTRYENVIRTLGASRTKAALYVILPMAKPGILAALVLTWARAVGEFGATVTLAGAAAFKTETLPVAIFLSFAKADVQQALIVVLALLAIALVVLLVIRKLGRRLATFD